MAYVFDGQSFERRKDMQETRRALYLELVSSGKMNFTQAAHAVGVSKRTSKVWRNGRGRSTGRCERALVDFYRGDLDMPKKIDNRFLSLEDRIDIADGIVLGKSVWAIARELGRSPSTISREIRNNSDAYGQYMPHKAQQSSTARLRRPKKRKLEHPRLHAVVQKKLDCHWSPEQISGWLKKAFPNNEEMHVCHETIYQSIYIQAKGALKRDIITWLRSGRVKRKERSTQNERRPHFREPMSIISERPAEVEDRTIPGHWESDLILGAYNKSSVGTLVERTTRFAILLHLPDGHTADKVQEAIIKKMQHLPKLMRNSLTWDQGPELALHKKSR